LKKVKRNAHFPTFDPELMKAESAKFPVISLFIRGIYRREGFDRDCVIRHTVWHVSLHYGEAKKSARGARFTRGRGRGECQRQRLSVKIA
jgi:hypothetical protein